MGSFNLTCGVSNLSISRKDKVLFIPLEKRNTKEENSNFYTNFVELYIPFSLPIEGTYDSYGNLTNIKENIHTKLLENKYGYSIKEIMDAFSENKSLNQKKGFSLLKELSGMFVLKDIYEEMIKYDLNLNLGELYKNNDKKNNLNRTVLKKYLYIWGFKLKEEKRSIVIFEKNGIEIILKDFFISFKNKQFYSVKDFISGWKKETKELLSYEDIINIDYNKERIKEGIIDISIIEKEDEEFDLLSDEEINEILISAGFTINENKSDLIDEEINEKEDKEIYKKEREEELLKDNIDKLADLINFSYWKSFKENVILTFVKNKDEELLNLILDFYYFQKMMIASNLMFRPSCPGLQYGCNIASKIILKSSLKHINNIS